MNRREFLVALIGTSAALAVLPSAQALTTFAPSDPTPYLDGYWLALTQARKIFCSRIAAEGWPFDPARLLMSDGAFGASLSDGTLVEHMLGVDARVEEIQHAQRAIEPVMWSLAQSAAYHGMDTFTSPTLPRGMEFAGIQGPLRLVVGYDVLYSRMFARFDVAGGTSALGLIKLKNQRLAQRKIGIRRTLAQPRRILPLPA